MQKGVCCSSGELSLYTLHTPAAAVLIHRVRDEIRMTIAAYQTLYESSIAFGMRKALMAEQGKVDLQQKAEQLEAECRDLEHQVREDIAQILQELINANIIPPEQVMELRNKCDAVEKTEAEKRQLSEKKHQEELQALRKTNQQLKVDMHL